MLGFKNEGGPHQPGACVRPHQSLALPPPVHWQSLLTELQELARKREARSKPGPTGAGLGCSLPRPRLREAAHGSLRLSRLPRPMSLQGPWNRCCPSCKACRSKRCMN